jgi:hypothetical protein
VAGRLHRINVVEGRDQPLGHLRAGLLRQQPAVFGRALEPHRLVFVGGLCAHALLDIAEGFKADLGERERSCGCGTHFSAPSCRAEGVPYSPCAPGRAFARCSRELEDHRE